MSKEDQLIEYIESLDGYKISETHFKIGSKIHSSDFYYAKRLFQNSYYTARIALLLAIKIKNKITYKNASLTLVGYEMYSELLLSLIEKFLTDYGYEEINHFLTIDTGEKLECLPDDVTPNNQVVIVVPITSTGSTSLKIEEYVKSTWSISANNIFHLNVLQARDEKMSEELNLNLDQDQETFIKLDANWETPSSCKWCFEKKELRPLFETDKSSLTPALIFDLPSAKELTEEELALSLPENFDDVTFRGALIQRKLKRNNEHFLFATKTDDLIDKNNNKIENWLKKLKDNIKIDPAERVIILSPCHYTNTRFINLVNDILFNSSATIIHHQADVDYQSNFKLLNKTFLTLENCKVFFVDDALISGATFFKLYDLYRFTTSYDPEKRLSGAIFLSNKSSADIHRRVSRAAGSNYPAVDSDDSYTGSIYSFVNINLPKPPKVFGQKPLEHEVKRYESVSNMALHDVPQKYFNNKSKDINGELHYSDKEESTEEDNEKKERHYKKFKATHKAYEYFNKQIIKNENEDKNSTDIDAKDLEDLLEKCGSDTTLKYKMAMMKVLSQYPFLLYKPVRKKVFTWHKDWFEKKILDLKKSINPESKKNSFITYDDFDELKFLIRRAVFLGNFYITSSNFFRLMKRIFEIIDTKDGIYKSIKEDFFGETEGNVPLNDKEQKNLNDFNNYLLYQYMELMQKNSWCAAQIKNNIKDIKNDFVTPQGKQFIRMLEIETAGVLNDFYALLNERNDWKYLYKNDGNNKPNTKIIFDNNKKITEHLEYLSREDVIDLYNKNKFKISNQVLELKDGDKLKGGFLNYLWVKQFLNTDQKYKAGHISLTDKTESVFDKLKGFFNKEHKVGAFFIVTDGKDEPHLVYDKDSNGNRFLHEIDEEKNEKQKHRILLDFLKGQTDAQEIAKKSIIEFEKIDIDKGNQWVDTYSLKNNPDPVNFVADAGWMMLIRISDQEFETKTKNGNVGFKTLGLMGFYAESNPNEILPKQLLMLLRKDLGAFINKHHKNDEFSALREAEAIERFAYLAGHGRQMMQRLGREPRTRNNFEGVVKTLEKLQYLIATKMITRSTVKEDSKKELSEYFLKREVNLETVQEIFDMGKKIFDTHIIENKVDLKGGEIQGDWDNEPFSFSFDGDILKFICFELILNAKKNRFHFIESENDSCECDNKKNELDIDLEIENKILTLKITGTGPEFNKEDKDKVNVEDLESIKEDSEIAGLNLINEVIKILHKDNTIIVQEPKPICMNCGIYKNTIVVELRAMDYE